MGVCEVCWLLDGDSSPKPVSYCTVCQAWICGRCLHDAVRRLRAAAIKRLSA